MGNAQRSWAQIPNINNRAQTDMEIAKKQKSVAHSIAESVAHIGEDNMHEAPEKKGQGSREMLSIADGCSSYAGKERAVEPAQGHMGVDHKNPNRSQMHSKMPRNTQTNEIVPISEVGLINHTTASPPHHENTNMYLMSSKVARDTQPVEDGPTTEVGLTNHTSANNSQHNNASPSHQTTEGRREWKVFVRKRWCKQKEAQ